MRKTCTVYCSYFHIRNETSTHRDRIVWLDPLHHFHHMADCSNHTYLLKSQIRELGWQWTWALNYIIHYTLWWAALLLLSLACFCGQRCIVQTCLEGSIWHCYYAILAHLKKNSQQRSKSGTNLAKHLTQSEPWNLLQQKIRMGNLLSKNPRWRKFNTVALNMFSYRLLCGQFLYNHHFIRN